MVSRKGEGILKIKVRLKRKEKKPVGTFVNNTEESDDWIRSLSGYEGETMLHDSLSRGTNARTETHQTRT